MRKVALISEHASPLAPPGGVDSGGQNIYVAHVARQLARLGYAVDVFTRRTSALLPKVFHWAAGVRVIHVPAGPPRSIPKEELLPHMGEFEQFLHRFFRAEARPYDLVHANFFMSGWAGLPVARRFGIPLVMTFHALGRVRRLHQQEADRFPECRTDIETVLLRDADRVIAECPCDRDDMLALYGADPRKIDIVPCGFDPDELSPVDRARARAWLGWDPREFAVLQLGRLVPRKGIDNVIRGVAEARRRHGVRAHLYVVGGNAEAPNIYATPEIARLQEIAREAGIHDSVTFVGRREREVLRYYYSAADVFATTPWYEPFGITPLEAMACGTPVIGSDVGGIRYSVADGQTGFLIPPNDPGAFAERLAQLHACPALRREMGQAGLRRVRAAFTWRSVARAITRAYDKALVRTTSTELAAPASA